MKSIKIALSEHKFDKAPVDSELTKGELIDILTKFPTNTTTKGDGRCLISGHFEGKGRLTSNLKQKTLLSLDVDFYEGNLKALENELKSVLSPYGYICYSTSSHTPDKPRIRIVLFLDKEVSVKSFRNISSNFIDNLGSFKRNIEKTSSCMPNNAMYLPIKTSEEYEPWSLVVDGEDILTSTFNATTRANEDCPLLKKIKRLDIDSATVVEFLSKIDVNDTDHNTWLKVGMALHHQTEGSRDGLELWLNWSLKDTRYKQDKIKRDCHYKWNSLGKASGKPISFSSVVSMVHQQSKDLVEQVPSKPTSGGLKLVTSTNCRQSKMSKLVPATDWYQVRGEKLTPVMCLENLEVLLKFYGIKIGHNTILKQQSIYIEGKESDNLNCAEAEIKSLCIRNAMPHALVSEFISAIASKNKINPWSDWVTSKDWDGVDRLEDFYKTVTVQKGFEKARDIYLKKWLLQMVHITCLNDGAKPKMGRSVLVFQGAQRVGKTTWFNHLVPEKKSNFIQSGLTLNVSSNMSVLACVRNAIVELGELDSTFRKSDMEHLKNFISSTRDVVDIKYQTYHMDARRRTVFFASVNDSRFLQDKTGNSRFLVLPVEKCNAFHGIDQQQLYAQVLAMAILDPVYDLTEEECALRDMQNKEFESISVIEEKFNELYDVHNTNESSYRVQTATKTLETLGFQVPNMKHYQNETAKMLDNKGYKRSSNPRYRGWYLPQMIKPTDMF